MSPLIRTMKLSDAGHNCKSAPNVATMFSCRFLRKVFRPVLIRARSILPRVFALSKRRDDEAVRALDILGEPRASVSLSMRPPCRLDAEPHIEIVKEVPDRLAGAATKAASHRGKFAVSCGNATARGMLATPPKHAGIPFRVKNL